MIKGNWSFREIHHAHGIGYQVFPKRERSHWSIRATLYPASDGKSFVISMDRMPFDARPSLDEAIERVLTLLNGTAQ